MDTHALNDWLSTVLSGAVVGSPLLDVLVSRLDLFLSIILQHWQEEVAGKKPRLFSFLPPALSSETCFFHWKMRKVHFSSSSSSQTLWDWSQFSRGHAQGRRHGPELQTPSSKLSTNDFVRIILGYCRHLWLDGKPIVLLRSSGMHWVLPNVLGKRQICPYFPNVPPPCCPERRWAPILPVWTQKIRTKGAWGFSGLNVGVSVGFQGDVEVLEENGAWKLICDANTAIFMHC